MIDLHMHSTFSDGSCTPGELVDMAADSGLKAIALTDHDTIDGVGRFLQAAAAHGIAAISGVELSAECSPGTMHILGYGVDIENAELCERLAWLRAKRANRNVLILEKINELGLELGWDEIAACAGSDVVGRPHFAQAMIARGYCSDKQEVFDKYLAKGRRAYVDRVRLAAEECIALIRSAGGVAVLAHPDSLKLSHSKLRAKVADLSALGLGGIECYYSTFIPRDSERILSLASEFGLLATGGSDFHGTGSPKLRMGFGFGSLAVPDELYDSLLAALLGTNGR
jgi:3',5'-nucleoside bisphosphate phosphatase